MQGITKEKSSPLYDTLMQTYKLVLINELARYPKEMLWVLVNEDDENYESAKVLISDEIVNLTNF